MLSRSAPRIEDDGIELLQLPDAVVATITRRSSIAEQRIGKFPAVVDTTTEIRCP